MSINLDLTNRLEKASKEEFIKSITICLKLLTNIINNPKEEKYRKFKKSNPKIANDLLKLNGVEQIFLEIGFELDNGEFVLRRGGIGVISKIKNYRDFLEKRLSIIESGGNKSSEVVQKTASIPNEKTIPIKSYHITASKPFNQRITFPHILTTNNNFLRLIENLSDSVMQYEDEGLQKSALKIIPLEKLKLNAIEKLRKFQLLIKEKSVSEDEPPLDDFILEELAEWFKNDFFTWVNNLNCRICKGETAPCGTKTENGVRVERFTCDKCNVITEFPRYNDIEKLLVTRRGRCGEFANCFTFLCRCLGYDARYIYCTSDHVWTEVYYHSKKKFVHVDPSENVFDSPLMYEHGWKRNLEYVIAFSRDDIQDVTWRYSNQHDEVKRRRKVCSEADLTDAIMKIRNKRQANVSEGRRKFLTLRTFAELGELLLIREPTIDEKKGRSSGSLAWRVSRGESNINSSNYIFKLLSAEKKLKEFKLRYTCSQNCYERLVDSQIVERANDWKLWEYKSENIFRKVENDHKMAYLSRTEDSENGMIQWKFDFDDMVIKSINLTFDTKTFENGQLRVSFIDDLEKIIASKDDLIGRKKFSICANFSGGKGDCAWQHSQLFRQNLNSNDFPFILTIQFE